MRIDNTMNVYLQMARQPSPPDAAALRQHTVQPAAQQASGTSRPWLTVDISPEGLAAYAKAETTEKIKGMKELAALTECQTCKNRKYQDVSNDPSVSFQTPTNINPGQSAAVVLAHEYEHVSNEKAKAQEEGRRIVSQNVRLESSICPECGRSYISGGVTQTVTVAEGD
jgi:hypothetical protein